MLKLNLMPLSDIKHHPNECVDVLAVVDKVDDISEVTARATQQLLKKRNVTLVDQSCTAVTMTLWANQASSFGSENTGRILAIKGASVREFNGNHTSI
jgi:ssDNA-binding replication factor A large subunit